MQLSILIRDSEYREALVERITYYDNDLLVNVVNGANTFNKDSLILTDIEPSTLQKEVLEKLKPRTLFLSASCLPDAAVTDCHRFFKYSSVADLLSEASILYRDWRGTGYGRDHSAKIISVFFENDAASYDRCMSLARQIIYRRGDRVLVIGLSYINDYGCDDCGSVNHFARMMYSISTGRCDDSHCYTYTDSYGISTLMLSKGRNPLAYLDKDELMGVIGSMAAMFDTLILDMGTCYRPQNLIVSENSDNIVFFENGRRYVGLEKMIAKEAASAAIKIRQSGGTEDVMAIDDIINHIYGNNGNENDKS